MRAVIYARYSSDLQRDESIEDQIHVCRVRADREGWTVVKTFHDRAMSGSTVLRPGYQEMLAFLRTGGADLVLAEGLERFARDQEHIAAFYKQVTHAGVKIVTLADGEVSEMHIGLKGMMGALYLKDLAAKTRRGLEGRARSGCFIGKPPYGYRIVQRLTAQGEPERGLREIDPEKAHLVQRIFTDYASGLSPRSIAKRLNAEGVPGPTGGAWSDTSIRGRGPQENGILRNPMFVGRLTWNRVRSSKNPLTGQRVRKINADEHVVVREKPELAIIDQPLWERVQDRIALEAARLDTVHPDNRAGQFWNQRRPAHLLSSKILCGCCGKTFKAVGKDYLACRSGLMDACPNTRRVRRPKLEARVLDALKHQLMRPDLVDVFIQEFRAAWAQESARAGTNTGQLKRDLKTVERQMGNLMDAVAEGIRAPDLQQRLDDLHHRKATLQDELARPNAITPLIPDDLAARYRERVEHLQDELVGPDHTEALETARTLIDRVVIHSPTDPDGEPEIELVGDLQAMFTAGGLHTAPQKGGKSQYNVARLFDNSVKEGLRT